MKPRQDILAFTDDAIYAMMKRVMKKYKLSWEEARDHVNASVKTLYSFKK